MSSEAKDLISNLLVVNATQRIQLSTVINHPWLLPDTAPATPLHSPNSLRRLGQAEDSINYSLHAYHQATKVGVVLGDPSTAPLVRKRKKKAEIDNQGKLVNQPPSAPSAPPCDSRPNTLQMNIDS